MMNKTKIIIIVFINFNNNYNQDQQPASNNLINNITPNNVNDNNNFISFKGYNDEDQK